MRIDYEKWKNNSTEDVIKGFKICCISNNLDGSKEDLVWERESNKEKEMSSVNRVVMQKYNQ